MVKNRSLKLLLSGLIIMTASVYLEGCLLKQLNFVNGPVGLNQVVISFPIQDCAAGGGSLNLEDIAYLAYKLPDGGLSYLLRQDAVAKGGHRSAPVKVLGTNSQWYRFCNLHMQAGAFWTPEREREGQPVAVISADLAARLFGSQEVLGMNIGVYGQEFLIVGIFKPQTALLDRWTDDRVPGVYIPGEVFFKTMPHPVIREVHIEAEPAASEHQRNTIDHLLLAMGKDPAAFTVFDYRTHQVLMSQVPQLQVFIMGLLLLLLLLRLIKAISSGMLRSLREDRGQYYPAALLKKHWRRIAALTVGGVAAALIMVCVWKRISFDLYIPSRYIPAELIDISHFTEVIKQELSSGQRLVEYYQPSPEAELKIARVINRCFYYVIWPLGLGMVWHTWFSYGKKAGSCNEKKLLDYWAGFYSADHRNDGLRR